MGGVVFCCCFCTLTLGIGGNMSRCDSLLDQDELEYVLYGRIDTRTECRDRRVSSPLATETAANVRSSSDGLSVLATG